MLLVLDANILFSILIRMSRTLELLLNSKLEIVSPDFILDEFIKHKDEISNKSGLDYSQLLTSIVLLGEKISFVAVEEYKTFLPRAVEISPDKDDVDYFVLALKLNCAIWSNDKNLKDQDKIKIYSTQELVELLKKFDFNKKFN